MIKLMEGCMGTLRVQNSLSSSHSMSKICMRIIWESKRNKFKISLSSPNLEVSRLMGLYMDIHKV